MPQYTTNQLKEIIRAAAARYGIDPEIGIRQLARESVNFNPYYVYGPGRSPAGAQGLAQFIPGTWARYGNGSPYDPVAAADAWGRYMRDLLRMFNGRYDLALAGYNWGENRTTLRTALASGQPVLNYSIPSETRGYVAAILGSGATPAIVATAPPPLPATTEPVALYPLFEPVETGSIFGGGVGAMLLVGGTLATLWWLDV